MQHSCMNICHAIIIGGMIIFLPTNMAFIQRQQQQRTLASPSSSSVQFYAAKKKKFKSFEDMINQQKEENIQDSTSLSTTTKQKRNSVLVITFTSPHCGPCHALNKQLAIVKQDPFVRDNNDWTIQFCTIDSNRYPSLSCRYNISDLPCTILFQGGEQVLRMQGYHDADEIVHKISSVTIDKTI
jgi:thioredoxin 1